MNDRRVLLGVLGGLAVFVFGVVVVNNAAREKKQLLDETTEPAPAAASQEENPWTAGSPSVGISPPAPANPEVALPDAPPAPPPPPAAPAPRETDPGGAQRLLMKVSKLASARELSGLTLSYVRPDGAMDPTYGKMEAKLSEILPPLPDDPSRPLGAPAPPDARSATCVDLTWEPDAEFVQRESMCFAFATARHQPLRCSVAQLRQRARGDGAPEGLATIELIGPPHERSWRFTISDAPRDVFFQKEYRDDCQPEVEQPGHDGPAGPSQPPRT